MDSMGRLKMKLSGLFKRAVQEPINFQPEGNDTYRSQVVSSKQFGKFCEVLRGAEIDPNAQTRDRGVTFSDPNFNAVYRDHQGKIVCDISVIQQLQQKGLMEAAGATVGGTKAASAQAPNFRR